MKKICCNNHFSIYCNQGSYYDTTVYNFYKTDEGVICICEYCDDSNHGYLKKNITRRIHSLFIINLKLTKENIMKHLTKLVAVAGLLFATNVHAKKPVKVAEPVVSYEQYRKNTDLEISKLGYTKLRTKLSNIIHNMDEPWDMIQYKQCLAKEIELNSEKGFNRKGKKDCSTIPVELPSARFTRLELIVDGIVLELNNAQDKYGRKWFWSNEDLALIALTKAYNESQRFSLKVHKGLARGDNGRSFSIFQIWSRNSDKYSRWDLVGYDVNKLNWSLTKLRNASYMALQHLTYHSYRCIAHEKAPNKGKQQDYSKYELTYQAISMVYAGYGSGWSCSAYHLRPKLKDGKKVRDADGKVVMVHGYEPMRRAKQFWALKVENGL